MEGRVKQLEPPSVDGIIRGNESVSPVPGKWGGGWRGEFSEMQLSACASPAGKNCTTLTHLHYLRDCAAAASFVLDARFVGSYLRVADRRIGTGPHYRPAYAVTSPYGGKALEPNPATAVAVVGQIASPIVDYPGECGPAPQGRAFISGSGVATIDCQGGCKAGLIAKREGREVRLTRILPERSPLIVPPPAELRITLGRILNRLGSGKVRLIALIDGKKVTHRQVSLLKVKRR